MALLETLYSLTDEDAVREELKDDNQREYFNKLVKCLDLVHEVISDPELSSEAERVARLILNVIESDLPTSYHKLLEESLYIMYETYINLNENIDVATKGIIGEIYKDSLNVYEEKVEQENTKLAKAHKLGANATGVPRNSVERSPNDSISSYPSTEAGSVDVGLYNDLEEIKVGLTKTLGHQSNNNNLTSAKELSQKKDSQYTPRK